MLQAKECQSSGIEEVLINLGEKIVRKLRTKIATHSDFSLNVFGTLSPHIQATITETLRGITDLVDSLGPNAYKNDIVRLAMARYKLQVDETFWNYVEEGDVVEVYDMDGMPVIQNMAFFELSSYDLMTLMSHPVHELFGRDQVIHDSVAAHASVIGRTPERWKTAEHVLHERLEKHNRTFWITPGYVAAVFDHSGKKVGWISSVKVKPLGGLYDGLNVKPIS